MKAAKNATLVLIFLFSFYQSFSQVSSAQTASSSAIVIPPNEPRVILNAPDESYFQSTAFDWKISGLKDLQTATALATAIKSKNSSVKNTTLTHIKGGDYTWHIEVNSALEAYQYFQMLTPEGVKYGIVNNKAIDLISYIQKKTGK